MITSFFRTPFVEDLFPKSQLFGGYANTLPDVYSIYIFYVQTL